MALKKTANTTLMWTWDSGDIENPRKLKNCLDQLDKKNVSDIQVSIRSLHYAFNDRASIRAIAQVSQWAKIRGFSFKIQIDPRHASRYFIENTGERLQYLLVTSKHTAKAGNFEPYSAPFTNGRFLFKYKWNHVSPAPLLQERAVRLEPVALERVFMFKKTEAGQIVMDSIKDITAESRWRTDMIDGLIEVYGYATLPPDEDWHAAAFPKCDSNVYDYAGRESHDLLCLFTENLFDACSHIDGLSWILGGEEQIAEPGRLPVSLSIYNCFKAEYGYDLRDNLYALVFDTDDASHIRIRDHYYSLLAKLIKDAQKDFYRTMHSFFPGLQTSVQFIHPHEMTLTKERNLGLYDIWEQISGQSPAVFSRAFPLKKPDHWGQVLTECLIIKSMHCKESNNRPSFILPLKELNTEELLWMQSLLALLSINCAMDIQEQKNGHEKANESCITFESRFDELLEFSSKISRITGFIRPLANICVVYPVETLKIRSTLDAESIYKTISRLIHDFFMTGLQIDVIPSSSLHTARLFDNGLKINDQLYQCAVYPWPVIVSQQTLDALSRLRTFGFPVYIGGSAPLFNTEGQTVSQAFETHFNPGDDHEKICSKLKLKPACKAPENALVSFIRLSDKMLYLFCPKKPGTTFAGRFEHGESVFEIEEAGSLVILQKDKQGRLSMVFPFN